MLDKLELHRNIVSQMKQRKKETVIDFINILGEIDNTTGEKILLALRNKDMLNSPTTAGHYGDELFKLLENSVALTITYRLLLTRLLSYIARVDKERMAEGDAPFGLPFLMGKVDLKED